MKLFLSNFASDRSRLIWVRAALAVTLAALAPTAGCNAGGGTDSALAAAVCTPVGSHMLPHSASSIGSVSGGPNGVRMLSGHVLKAQSQSLDQGRIADEQEMPVTVSLSLNNESDLARELAEVYDPANVKYRQFLRPEEFRAKYGPTPQQIAEVTAFLEKQGLHSVAPDENGLLVRAVGSARNVGAAFGTEVHQYQDLQGQAFHAPNQELSVPAHLMIQGVHGLQDHFHAHNHLRQPAASDHPVQSQAATGPSGGFSPADINSAYGLTSSGGGAGQTLALFELDGYTASDISAYEANFGLPAVPLQNVLVSTSTGSAGGGAAEVTLDIELMIAVSPKAAKILVYEGPNDDQGILATYSKIASDNVAQSISTSWGSSEGAVSASFIQSENAIFAQMALQGQTIYSAAGDSGAKDNGTTLSVDDPSSQPYVVGVGGTSLKTTAAGMRQSETTWNDSSGGGGGGISTVWSIPTWQQGLASATNQASSAMRNVPDVALNADIATGYSIYYNGAWSVWGGTSCAAPLWAAFNALVNQQRATRGLAPIGYITPALYALGRSTHGAADFFDVADSSTNGYFPAVAGYDDATGWGSFNGGNLLEDLSSTAAGLPAGTSVATCGG